MGKISQQRRSLLLCDGGMRVEPFKEGYLINLSRIRERAREIAPITASFMFDYQDGVYEYRIKNLYDSNFFYVTCPRLSEAEKNKDKTDWILSKFIYTVVPMMHDITDIVLMANDSDFVPVVSFMKDLGKKVTLFCYKNPAALYNSFLEKEDIIDISAFALIGKPE